MAIDMNKYRKMSSFAGTGGGYDFERKMVVKQAVNEFDYYQKYSPNTHKVYVNDSATPILATFQDVSDLEVRADTKWMATSLSNRIYAGDIITWNSNGIYTFDTNGRVLGKKWLVVYDKEKNTANSRKVKVQPCNYAIKFPFYNTDGTPNIYTADSIVMTYLTDSKDFKQPFPTETGTTFISVPYNDITATINRESRIWLYDSAFLVGGVDFTNIDFYINKGFLKWTLRPSNITEDLDRIDLGICDYYKFFTKQNVVNTIPSTSTITLSASSTSVGTYSKVTINATLPSGEIGKFIFDGNNIGCTLTNVTSNSCTLNVGSEIGIVYVKCYLESNPSEYEKIRIVVSSSW